MQRLWNRMATLMLYLGIDTVLVLNDAIHTVAPYHITDERTNNVNSWYVNPRWWMQRGIEINSELVYINNKMQRSLTGGMKRKQQKAFCSTLYMSYFRQDAKK